MNIILVRILDISDGQAIEFLRFSTAIDIDRKENWPGHTHSNEAYQDDHFQESKEEIGIEGLLLQQFIIFQPEKSRDPVKAAVLVQGWRSFAEQVSLGIAYV